MRAVAWPQPKVKSCSVAETWLTDLENGYVNQALDSNWIGSDGIFNNKSEEKLTSLFGQRALLVSNGSVAIMLALKALGIGDSDEVLVPNLTYAATASSVINVGAVPILCDVDIDSWGISIDSMKRMISSRTKAIIVVHLYGVPAKMASIMDFANKHGLFVIEDCAESFLAQSAGKQVGTFGDIATYSFFANKLVTSGEGGAVSTNDKELLEKMRLLRGQGMDPLHRYHFLFPGFNFRMTNLQAAVLFGQLERLNEISRLRKDIEEKYRVKLSRWISGQILQEDDLQAPWLFTTRLRDITSERKFELAQRLAEHGIETRPLFYPLSDMPAFSGLRADDYSSSRIISREGISLPTGHHVDNQKMDSICKILIEFLS